MSIYDVIKSRYGFEMGKDLDDDEIQKLISGNFIPADHIIKDGKTLNIYTDNVSIPDICKFFKTRIPGIKFKIGNDIFSLKKADEIILAKYIIYAQLSGLLMEVRSPKLKEPLFESDSSEDYVINGKTLH